MKKRRFLFCSLLIVTCSLAFAQTAAEMDTLLETGAVSVAAASRFVLGSAGLLPGLSGTGAETAAYEEALSRGFVRAGAEDEITLMDTAFLIMNVFEIKGGLMYSLFQSPRYAYREMIYRRLILGRAYSNMKVSGWQLLQIIGRTLNYTGEREEMDSMLINSGASNE